MSLLREPARRRFNAIMVAGAGPPRPGPPWTEPVARWSPHT
ncbi:hypothetical protein [Streptomyces mirabilis]